MRRRGSPIPGDAQSQRLAGRLPGFLRSRTLGMVVGTLLGMLLVFISCVKVLSLVPGAGPCPECPPPTPTPGPTPLGQYQQPTHRGGTLTYGDWQFPVSTNPWFASYSADREVEDALWGSPIVIRPDGKLLPDELTGVPTVQNGDVSADGLKVMLRLRPDLKWSDGQPLTAYDFIYWLKVLLDPRSNATSTYGFDQLASYQAMDAHTLLLTYKQPFAAYLNYLPDAAPQHAWGSIPDGQLQSTQSVNLVPTVTNGPFLVSQAVSGQSITMVPNRWYVSTTLHSSVLNTLIFKAYQTKDELIAAYEAGQVDHAEDFTLGDLATLHTLPGVQLGPSLIYTHLDFNLQQPVLQDVNVRRAIAQALDRCQIIERVFNLGCDTLRVDTVLPRPDPDFDPSIHAYPFNLAAARADMQAAGWDCSSGTCRQQGVAFPALTLVAETYNTQFQAAADLIKQQLAALGIPVNVAPPFYPTGPINGPVPCFPYFNSYDLAFAGFFAFSPDSDANLYPYFHSSQIPSAAHPAGSNCERVNDPQVDHWLDAGRTTVDQTARSNIYKQVQRYLLQQVYILPLYLRPNITLTESKVGNYAANPLSLLAGGNEWNIGEWYDASSTSEKVDG